MKARRAKAIDWAARGAFFVSVLALLGTSKPKGWTLQGTVEGTRTAPADRALEVTIDSSSEPRLRAHDLPKLAYSYDDRAPCPRTWAAGKKATCLLPPGATLDSLEIEGSCGGCSSNCPPPPGAFARASGAAVPVWKDVASTKLTAKLPSHPSSMIASSFIVKASGARFFEAKLSVVEKTVGILFSQAYACSFEGEGRASCYFLVNDDIVKGKGEVDVVAEVTGWGTDCKQSDGGKCTPAGTLKIESLELGK